MTDTIDQLNAFLRGEISAVETHKQAIDKLGKSQHVATLRDNLASHEARVTKLRDEIKKYGGTPSEGSGIWGTFAKMVEGGAAAFGEKAAIAALEEGEDHGRDDYKAALDKATPPLRETVQWLFDQQLKSHDVISNLKRRMRAEVPPQAPV